MNLVNPTKQLYEAPISEVMPLSTEESILSGSATIDDMGDETMFDILPLAVDQAPSSFEWII